jgi:hypothetical protein
MIHYLSSKRTLNSGTSILLILLCSYEAAGYVVGYASIIINVCLLARDVCDCREHGRREAFEITYYTARLIVVIVFVL